MVLFFLSLLNPFYIAGWSIFTLNKSVMFRFPFIIYPLFTASAWKTAMCIKVQKGKYSILLHYSQVMPHGSSNTLLGFTCFKRLPIPYSAALPLSLPTYLSQIFTVSLSLFPFFSGSLYLLRSLSCPPLLLWLQLIHEQHHDWILIIHISSPWWLITTLQMEKEGEGE